MIIIIKTEKLTDLAEGDLDAVRVEAALGRVAVEVLVDAQVACVRAHVLRLADDAARLGQREDLHVGQVALQLHAQTLLVDDQHGVDLELLGGVDE